jgi:hypothetical protein
MPGRKQAAAPGCTIVFIAASATKAPASFRVFVMFVLSLPGQNESRPVACGVVA